MFVHNDLNSLYQHVPQKYLPVEYGGENGTIDQIIEDACNRILENREYFLEESKYGTDEKLRPGKPIDFDTIFGVEGSFRQLNVD